MSGTSQDGRNWAYNGHRRTKGTKIRIDDGPSEQDLAEQPHEGEERDRFSQWTPDQIDAETRNVRLDMSFGDLGKIRDQAFMVIQCMHAIIAKTKHHDLGSVQQRIEARREADSLRRVLARTNNRKPRTNTYKPR